MMPFPQTAVLLANGPTVIDDVPIAPYPKFMLPVANRPLFEYQVSMLAAAGVKEIIVCVSCNCDDAFERLMAGMGDYPVQARCITQSCPRGTGGTLKSVEALIKGNLFWLLGADLLLDADLKQMLAFHHNSGSMATVAAVLQEDPPWGHERVECDDAGSVKAIHRIHPAQSRRSKIKPLGLYLFDRQILDKIPQEGYFDLKEQLFGVLYDASSPARVWETSRYSQTISSLDSYMAANRDVLLDRAVFPFIQKPVAPAGREIEPGGAQKMMIPPLSMADGVRLGSGVTLVGPLILGRHSDIGDHAVLNASLIFPGASIGPRARLTNCIVCENAVVQAGVDIRDRVVTDQVKSPDGQIGRLKPNTDHIPGETGSHSKGHISHRRGYLFWKRCFDVVFSFSTLLLLSPLMLLIAMAIALDSPGKIIFRQRRCGWNGVDFTMYKFRTMVNNAEAVKREIQHMNEVDGPMFKIASDPRVTRVGYYLRATNLDEVPQFVNILLGHMALVGPRPLSWDEMRYNPRWRDLRITVPPGLIGLWQLRSHTRPTFWDWIHYDLKYVRECSAWLDIKIILLSMVQSVKGVFSMIGKIERKKGTAADSLGQMSRPTRN